MNDEKQTGDGKTTLWYRPRDIHGWIWTIISSVVLAVAVLPADSSAQQTAAALDIIADFADRICGGEIEIGGRDTQFELSGEAKLELTGLVKKLADLGIEGAAKYTTSEYEGLLREDLAEVLRDKSNCKSEVAKDLVAKLVDSIVPEPESPYQTATRVANAWHEAIMARDDAATRNLMVLPLQFNLVELRSVREVVRAYAGGLRNMLNTPNRGARIDFDDPMTILELFADWEFSTDDAMMRHMNVQRQDLVVPVTISDGGEGSVLIIVRPGVRYQVVRIWLYGS